MGTQRYGRAGEKWAFKSPLRHTYLYPRETLFLLVSDLEHLRGFKVAGWDRKQAGMSMRRDSTSDTPGVPSARSLVQSARFEHVRSPRNPSGIMGVLRCVLVGWRSDSSRAIIVAMALTDLIQGPRQAAGLTQRGLAALAHVPQPSIAELESGAQGDATVGLLERLLGPCGGQLIAVPTTTPSVAAAGAALRRSVREGHVGLLFRQLIQVNDDLADEPPATRLALCLTPPPLTGDRCVDAFLAAVVEYRLRKDRLPVPDWTSLPDRYCDPPWDVAGIPALTEDVRATTPAPFKRHGVLIAADELASV